MFVCVRVRVCVRERDTQRERERERETNAQEHETKGLPLERACDWLGTKGNKDVMQVLQTHLLYQTYICAHTNTRTRYFSVHIRVQRRDAGLPDSPVI